jgi:hypothetical protein
MGTKTRRWYSKSCVQAFFNQGNIWQPISKSLTIWGKEMPPEDKHSPEGVAFTVVLKGNQ